MTKEQNSKNLIEIPENATIGDVIKAIFPDWKIEHIRKMSGLDRYDINIDSLIDSVSMKTSGTHRISRLKKPKNFVQK